jgi:hypothetical protein
MLHTAKGQCFVSTAGFPACSQCLHDSLAAFPRDPQGDCGHMGPFQFYYCMILPLPAIISPIASPVLDQLWGDSLGCLHTHTFSLGWFLLSKWVGL